MLALGLATLLSGCAAGSHLLRPDPVGAQQFYDNAVDDLESSLYPEAISGFNDVKSRFPYSPYSPLAELGIADTEYKRGSHLEAVDRYRNFLKYYPKHAKAPYAMHRIGEAFFSQIPSDWWFLPPSEEKDQANTRLAITSFRDAIARFPDAEVTVESKKRLRECRVKLADHEIYVARFYHQRFKYRAAQRRAEALLKTYPGLGLDAEALFLIASAHLRLGEVEAAAKGVAELRERFPLSAYLEQLTPVEVVTQEPTSAQPGENSEDPPADG